MKAVVIKINKNKAVVLMSDGTFHNVPNKSYAVGQEMYITKASKTASYSRLVKYAAAAAAALLVLFSGASYAYTIPQSYISIDINPGIEFDLNIFNRVINPQGVNHDGIELLNNVSIQNKTMQDAIHAVVSQLKTDGYIVSEGKSVVLGVQSDSQKRQQKTMESARVQVEKSLESLHLSAHVAVNPVTEQTIENAHGAGTTGGKLELIEEYLEAYPEGLSFDELINMTVSDILYELNNAHFEDDDSENEYNYDEDDHDEDEYNEGAAIEDDAHSEDEIDDEYYENHDDESDQEQTDKSDEDEESYDSTDESDDETDESDDEESDEEPDEEHDESSDDEEEPDS